MPSHLGCRFTFTHRVVRIMLQGRQRAAYPANGDEEVPSVGFPVAMLLPHSDQQREALRAIVSFEGRSRLPVLTLSSVVLVSPSVISLSCVCIPLRHHPRRRANRFFTLSVPKTVIHIVFLRSLYFILFYTSKYSFYFGTDEQSCKKVDYKFVVVVLSDTIL